ncbi:MAG TPA: MFS transporter, partial [Bacillus sp. (in: firmicutes)]|nr:MFS transporter [Bacillus sp. (in: firmicutes)]
MSATDDIRSHPSSEQISFDAWKTILILCGTIVIFLYLNTAMSPALPSIAEDFKISQTLASWVMTAYMICGAVMTVIMGRLSDLVGAKKMLMVMMICFTIGTILAPFSPNIYILLGLRVLEGIAVDSTPISTKLIRDGVPKSKFPIGLSVYLSAYSGGMALGAILGPVVAAGGGWQSNFYFCAPIAVVLSFACWKFIKSDESKKVEEHHQLLKPSSSASGVSTSPPTKAMRKKREHLDFIGIITLTVTIVSFLIAITLSQTIKTNFIAFAVPLIIGVIFLVVFMIAEKRAKSPLVNLKLAFHPVIFTGNIMMLMFGILQYFVITGIPQLGSAPAPSGLGLDPLNVGFLQMSFGLSAMIFGPVFGLLIAKRKGLNLKLLVPGIAISAISFLLLLFFHSTSQAINGALFIFGTAGALLPMTLNNTNILFTPVEYTGISSATTNMMRIIGGAIGPVMTTV